jgi:hypothetical protein
VPSLQGHKAQTCQIHSNPKASLDKKKRECRKKKT